MHLFISNPTYVLQAAYNNFDIQTNEINYNNERFISDLNKMLSNKSIFDNSKNIVLSATSKKMDDEEKDYIDSKDVELVNIII